MFICIAYEEPAVKPLESRLLQGLAIGQSTLTRNEKLPNKKNIPCLALPRSGVPDSESKLIQAKKSIPCLAHAKRVPDSD